MKSLTESPAILTVHAGVAGQYIVRVTDLRDRALVSGVIKLLPDAVSIVVITPADIKVFATGAPVEEPPPVSDVMPPSELDPEMQAAIDSETRGTHPPPVETLEEPPPQPTVRRRKKQESIAGHDERCGRCAGTGQTRVILDGGKGSDVPCPICQGSGIIKRYGARR